MADIIDIDGGDPKRRAIREIKWLSNSLKGMCELADALVEPLDLEKEAATLRAEIAALKAHRKNYTDLQGEIASAKSELARITADIDTVRAKFRNA